MKTEKHPMILRIAFLAALISIAGFCPGQITIGGNPIVLLSQHFNSFEHATPSAHRWSQTAFDDFNWSYRTGGTPSSGTGGGYSPISFAGKTITFYADNNIQGKDFHEQVRLVRQ